jgi:hypothetical protein
LILAAIGKDQTKIAKFVAKVPLFGSVPPGSAQRGFVGKRA